MSKDILFYSNQCEYSKKIYGMVGNSNSILCVCVDDPNVKLPTFVQAVPLIYVPSQKRIIVDEAVELWAKTNFSQQQGMGQQQQQHQQRMNNPPTQEQPSSFQSSGSPSGEYFTGGFSFSTQFSSLDDGDNSLDGGCGFADLSSPMEQINTPADDGNKMDTNAMFEQYQQMRNKEFSQNKR